MSDISDAVGLWLKFVSFVILPLAVVGLISFLGGVIWFVVFLAHHVHWIQ